MPSSHLRVPVFAFRVFVGAQFVLMLLSSCSPLNYVVLSPLTPLSGDQRGRPLSSQEEPALATSHIASGLRSDVNRQGPEKSPQVLQETESQRLLQERETGAWCGFGIGLS